jgi:hypothetical protein
MNQFPEGDYTMSGGGAFPFAGSGHLVDGTKAN